MEGKPEPWSLDDRAVSPELGAILMVAILVILGVVIGVFVLDLGKNVEQKPDVAVTFNEDPDSGEVTIQVNSVQRADRMRIDASDCGGGSQRHITSPRAGATQTVTCTGPGTIKVIATYNGNSEVIQEYEYEG